MSDNTTLNPGASGDTIATEDVGGGVKIPVTKIRIGAHGTDGGDVTTSNPFPVAQASTPWSEDIVSLGNWGTGQVTVNSTSSAQIASSALSNRKTLLVKAICASGQKIYIGNSSGVTTSTGFPLGDGDAVALDLSSTPAMWAIASADGQTLAYLEIGT